MNEITPTFADWYPDAATGGTKYWDGTRWTGDTRPRRKPFAAAARDNDKFGLLFLALGAPGLAFLGAFGDEVEGLWAKLLWFVSGVVLLLALIACGIYLFRGQGPTTASIEQRLAAEEKSAKGRRRSANLASFAERLVGRGRPQQPAPSMLTRPDTTAAQINAISTGETTRSLEKLQHLLYSGAITDLEYQAAKDKLLGTRAIDDPFAQVAKLAELHRDGVLGDVEFAAAKARVLDL
jgi:hypothetical protein